MGAMARDGRVRVRCGTPVKAEFGTLRRGFPLIFPKIAGFATDP